MHVGGGSGGFGGGANNANNGGGEAVAVVVDLVVVLVEKRELIKLEMRPKMISRSPLPTEYPYPFVHYLAKSEKRRL